MRRPMMTAGVLAMLLRAAAANAAPPPADQLPPAPPTPPVAAPPRAPAPAPEPAPPPYARANRFAFSLGFGFGSASLSELHDFADTVVASIEQNNPNVDVQGAPTSGLQINAELAFRYYFPYYVLAQVGYAAIYNKASTTYSAGAIEGKVTNDNLVMEVPILVGGYYTFIDRLYAYGAVGPSVFVYPRSWWDASGGAITDFKADPGVGFHALVGADFLITDVLALGLEVRYRYLKTDQIVDIDFEQRPIGGSPELDFSGVSLGIVLRFYAI